MQDQDEYAALNWDCPTTKSVLEDFIEIIKGSQIIGFGVAVDAVAWRHSYNAISFTMTRGFRS